MKVRDIVYWRPFPQWGKGQIKLSKPYLDSNKNSMLHLVQFPDTGETIWLDEKGLVLEEIFNSPLNSALKEEK